MTALISKKRFQVNTLIKVKKLAFGIAIGLGASLTLIAPSHAENIDVDSLLNLVKQGQARDDSEFKSRMQRFNTDKQQQQNMLQEAKDQRTALESDSATKEAAFANNETDITAAQERLTNRLGSLKELFGVLQQVAGDSKGIFEGSLITSELNEDPTTAGREQFLDELISTAGSSSKLPSIEELEQLWFEMQREMTLSGKVSSYQADVVLPTGDTVKKQVVRLGSFNAISEGQYLTFDYESQKLVELASQPGSRYNGPASDLESAQPSTTETNFSGFWIDPSRGQLLKIMGQSAGLGERIDQGGVVGYIILSLAIIGVLLAIWRMIKLTAETARIKKQMNSDSANNDNALGRIMTVYQNNGNTDVETLELHLSEAISSEIPSLTRGINWIKIISVVAPLLGLLGTVTGMIDVFETMSLFGTGDPKLMAGGISQALITTVLGLVAAIPCVFLHTMTNNRSRALITILEERATGILARKSEQLSLAKA
ncbi:TonB system biopolymer transport component [Oleispira antarctica RB-8]|uniref:TonB system biopolymer transport component n=1 Tax=Oleispira antarctica RB-8 TaxID=698738 RepID=R4YSZ7_OLEAN|nr:TonB system biopolymer transport component [Oleispira antarctica RB-8]